MSERLADLLAHPTLRWPGNKRLNMLPGNPWWANWDSGGYCHAFNEANPDWVWLLDDALAYRVLRWSLKRGEPLPDAPPGRLPSRTRAQDYPFPHPETLETPGSVAPEERRRAMVLHIPHASTAVPPHRRPALLLDDAELADELRVMTDWRTELLYPVTPWEGERVAADVSRLVVDVERFPDDADEPMAAVGMGVVYTRTHRGGVLRAAPSAAERGALLEAHYWPHHDALTLAVGRVVHAFGGALLVDCHSFPSRPLPHDLDQSPGRPALCIGTGPRTPGWVVQELLARAGMAGWSVGIDAPFAGALVPRAFADDPRVAAVMIEVRRDLYVDEANGLRGRGFDAVQQWLADALSALGRRFAAGLAQAAVTPPRPAAMPLFATGEANGVDRSGARRRGGGGDHQPA